jgi:hypothetical protein
MTKYKSYTLFVLQSALAIAVTFLFLHLAINCYFADSEIWLLTLSQKALQPFELSSIFYKWSFHFLTYLFSHFAPTEVDVYFWARIGWGVVAVATQLILAFTFSRAIKEKSFVFPLFILLMTSSIFFNQGFRIRGDILSLFAHSIILLLLILCKNTKIRWFHYLAQTFFILLMMLSTPKAVYFLFAQFVFALLLWRKLKLKRDYFLWVWFTHVLPIVIVTFITLLSHLLPARIDLIDPIHEALDFFLKSYDANLFNTEYLSIYDFAHVIKFLGSSPIHTIVISFGLILYFYQLLRKGKNETWNALNAYFGIIFCLVLLHNQKLPFFLGTYGSPIIAYCGVQFFLFVKKYTPKWEFLVVLITTAAATFIALMQYQTNMNYNNNFGQMIAINTLDDYVTRNPKIRYYDIIGLLPRKTSTFLFVGPSEVSRKKAIIGAIDKLDLDMIIMVYKFVYLEPEIKNYLTEHRVPIEKNIWVKGDYFSVTQTTQYFKKTYRINEKPYWVLPIKPKHFIFDLLTHENITAHALYLDQRLKVVQEKDATQVAIPEKFLSVVLTNVPPVRFLQPPYFLFRFDTTF